MPICTHYFTCNKGKNKSHFLHITIMLGFYSHSRFRRHQKIQSMRARVLEVDILNWKFINKLKVTNDKKLYNSHLD